MYDDCDEGGREEDCDGNTFEYNKRCIARAFSFLNVQTSLGGKGRGCYMHENCDYGEDEEDCDGKTMEYNKPYIACDVSFYFQIFGFFGEEGGTICMTIEMADKRNGMALVGIQIECNYI